MYCRWFIKAKKETVLCLFSVYFIWWHAGLYDRRVDPSNQEVEQVMSTIPQIQKIHRNIILFHYLPPWNRVLQKFLVRSSSQGIPHILWNPKVHYHVHIDWFSTQFLIMALGPNHFYPVSPIDPFLVVNATHFHIMLIIVALWASCLIFNFMAWCYA
jgi:hypothetical protein